jgi:hypothetical protein
MDHFETLFDHLASFLIENIELDALYQFFGNTIIFLIAKGSLIGMTPQISDCSIEEQVRRIIFRLCSTF